MAGTDKGTQTNQTTNTASGNKVDITKLLEIAKSRVGSTGGAAFTQGDADYVVQAAYQQMLGRNAVGQEYAQALQTAMGQAQQTGTYGRMQAVMNYIQQTPEYQMELEDKYMDAVYNAVAASARKVQS